MKKKVLSLLLACTMLTGVLAGCGSSETKNEVSEKSEVKSEEASKSESVSNEKSEGESIFDENGISGKGQLPIVEENIELSIFMKQNPSQVDITENQVTISLQDRTNITLNITAVPQDSAAEKLQLMLMNGDYPDIIAGSGYLTPADLITYGTEEEIFIPLNDLIDKYCVNIQERWADHEGLKEDMTSPDGNIYGIVAVDSAAAGHTKVGYKLWINTAWLDNVGLDMPTTTEEFRTVLEAFRDQDANGNGDPNDEVPFTGSSDASNGLPYMAIINAFGHYDTDGFTGGYYMKDGEVKTFYDQEYLRDALKYLKGLYDDGLLDSASFTQNESEIYALSNATDGRVGVAAGTHLGSFMDRTDAERAAQYEALGALEGPDGYNKIPYHKGISVEKVSWVITDKCKYPEAAIKLIDLFCGEEWTIIGQVGEQGVEWDYADPGMVTALGEPAKYKYLESERTQQSPTVESWGWVLRGIEPNWKGMFALVGDVRDHQNYEAFLSQQTAKYDDYAAEVDIMPTLHMDADKKVEFSTLTTMVDDYHKQAIVEFIIGERDLDKDWDTYLADLERLGYSTIIDMVEETLK